MSECIVRVEGGMRQDGARAAYIRLENSDVIQMLVYDDVVRSVAYTNIVNSSRMTVLRHSTVR
jgi:hypothetical protein